MLELMYLRLLFFIHLILEDLVFTKSPFKIGLWVQNTYNFYFSFLFVYKFYCLKIIKNEFIKGNKIFKDSKNNNKNKLLKKKKNWYY